jgi:Phage gp6-like head-tail connector protein
MITADLVKSWLHLTDAADDDLIAEVVAATNAWVAATAYVRELPDPNTWPDDVMLGAVMLAARLYRRRNTPSGVEPFIEGAVYLPRRDHDVDAMLHQGYYAPPRVG